MRATQLQQRNSSSAGDGGGATVECCCCCCCCCCAAAAVAAAAAAILLLPSLFCVFSLKLTAFLQQRHLTYIVFRLVKVGYSYGESAPSEQKAETNDERSTQQQQHSRSSSRSSSSSGVGGGGGATVNWLFIFVWHIYLKISTAGRPFGL